MNKAKELFELVCAAETVETRLGRATQASLRQVDEDWVQKTGPWVEWETEMYLQIEEVFGVGRIAPELGDFGPGYLNIKLIDQAASLEDYAIACAARPEFTEVWVKLCIKVGQLIAEFHQEGFIHGDLHCGNIVIGPGLRPLLIDFELGAHPEGESPVELVRERSTEWDFERLDETLRDISSASHYLKGLEALAIAYNS